MGCGPVYTLEGSLRQRVCWPRHKADFGPKELEGLWDPGVCVEEAGGEMNMGLRSHARPPIRTWEPSQSIESRRGWRAWRMRMGGAGLDAPYGTWVAEREQPHRWEANQNFPLVEGGQRARCCCSMAEEELEGVALQFGDLWGAAADGAGRAGPISPSGPAVTCRCRSLCPPWVGAQALGCLSPASPPPLCLPGALGGHAQGGWPTASSSFCRRDREETGPN